MDISKFVNQSGLQKWNEMGYKNSKNRYPQNRLTSVECILDMSPKISKMENVYLYTITEFTHLFVDIKHMKPVTEIPVADLTFGFDGKGIKRSLKSLYTEN